MNTIRKPIIGLILIALSFSLAAQKMPVSDLLKTEILQYTSSQIEELFLANNLQLIAEKMNISLADAEIEQSKRLENPELSIGSVNFWGSEKQRAEVGMNGFPRNTQFSVELSQLVQTARKRSKLVNMNKVSKQIALQEFEEVMRALKAELRRIIAETSYLQSYVQILSEQHTSIERLATAYKKQVEQGNLAATELLRLQSELLELQNEINETRVSLNQQQKTLKSLLNISPNSFIKIEEIQEEMPYPVPTLLHTLFDIAAHSRPDLKQKELQTLFFEKSLIYEKSKRIPDVTLSANFDRYGGIWKDFIGVGIGFELPVFNRNQGNIKASKIGIMKSRQLSLQQQNIAQHEITEAFTNYTQAYHFYEQISTNDLISELDNMLKLYTKNLLNKNISMLEYLDFIDAYGSNRKTLLSAKKERQVALYELQYYTGSDIIKNSKHL